LLHTFFEELISVCPRTSASRYSFKSDNEECQKSNSAPQQIKIPVNQLRPHKNICNRSDGQKRAERNFEFQILLTDQHDNDADNCPDGRAYKDCKQHPFPSDERADHCQQLDIPESHALISFDQFPGFQNQIKAPASCQYPPEWNRCVSEPADQRKPQSRREYRESLS